jgi:FixJ family two-component response regulator
MNSEDAIVFVIDDDSRIREALLSLIRSVGLKAAAFGSASEFLVAKKPDCPACIVLDLQLPDVDGLQLQQELGSEGSPPIVFITGHGTVPASVRAMKAGAIEFLSKPFSDHDLLAAIESGLILDRARRQSRMKLDDLQQRYRLLTPREQEVLRFVVSGFANKETAYNLAISEITIGVHRGQVMRKMRAQSLADLVRMADKLGIAHITSSSE